MVRLRAAAGVLGPEPFGWRARTRRSTAAVSTARVSPSRDSPTARPMRCRWASRTETCSPTYLPIRRGRCAPPIRSSASRPCSSPTAGPIQSFRTTTLAATSCPASGTRGTPSPQRFSQYEALTRNVLFPGNRRSSPPNRFTAQPPSPTGTTPPTRARALHPLPPAAM